MRRFVAGAKAVPGRGARWLNPRAGGLDHVRVAKSTLSQHLRVLREAGITHTRPTGTQRWLSVRREDLDAIYPGLLDVVLAAVAGNVREYANSPVTTA